MTAHSFFLPGDCLPSETHILVSKLPSHIWIPKPQLGNPLFETRRLPVRQDSIFPSLCRTGAKRRLIYTETFPEILPVIPYLMTKRLRPDIVLTDIGMPCLGGVKATLRISREAPSVRACGHPYDVP